MRIPRIIITVSAVILIFLTGWFGRSMYDSMQLKSARSTGSSFVSDLTKGNNAAAYKLTASTISKKQTLAQFTSNVGNVKSTTAKLSTPVVQQGDGVVYFSQTVSNLPQNADGTTSGTFVVNLKKNGTSWQVTSLQIQ